MSENGYVSPVKINRNILLLHTRRMDKWTWHFEALSESSKCLYNY